MIHGYRLLTAKIADSWKHEGFLSIEKFTQEMRLEWFCNASYSPDKLIFLSAFSNSVLQNTLSLEI